ncbi:uncharacterized protein F5891DRAFT_1173995 [Suillus fuscotomentosus]|uniref:Uncharacterized protein n=1 Tax=Suillus fuscotomentosus TaxID=1912939 RepID=A0AAD4E383_9AGAM|nr:uncharacterized protein F5891DRAFT_1173995 [Suillus fuscotomentosus]KAG1898900.1 hypothetical protein F5891DRAFT_1173995 [Suillus fuscotomentosus]
MRAEQTIHYVLVVGTQWQGFDRHDTQVVGIPSVSDASAIKFYTKGLVRCAKQNGFGSVYANLDNRSPAAHQCALDAGMITLPIETFLSKSNFISNIVPPGEENAFAQKIHSTLGAHFGSALLLRASVDCNTVNPETVLGTPPREGWDPTFYACSEPGAQDVLEDFAALSQYRLEVSLVKGEGAGIGDANSLKLCESPPTALYQQQPTP